MATPFGPLPPPNNPWVQPDDGRPALAFAQYARALDGIVRAMLGAWTAYTPSLAPIAGAFGAASATGKFLQVGKTVHFEVVITITTNGTGAGSISVGLPVQAAGPAMSIGRENAVSGHAVVGLILASSIVANVVKYDGTYPGASGASIVLSGTYDAL